MPNADVVEVYKDDEGQWRWRRIAPNGEKVSGSEEGFEHRQHAIESAEKYNEATFVLRIKGE